AAGTRLAEALAPDLLGRQHRRDEAAALGLAAVVDQRRPEEADAEEVDDGRRVGPRELGLEQRLLDLRRSAAAPLRWPAHAEVACLVELPLPAAAELDQAVLGRARVAQLFSPRSRHVGAEPGAE